jgi:hypothetical protein
MLLNVFILPAPKGPTTTPAPPKYKPALYQINFFTTYCVWWDPKFDMWQADGCRVYTCYNFTLIEFFFPFFLLKNLYFPLSNDDGSK